MYDVLFSPPGMKSSGPLPALIGSMLIVAGLCALMFIDGWPVLIPTILALVVVGSLSQKISR